MSLSARAQVFQDKNENVQCARIKREKIIMVRL